MINTIHSKTNFGRRLYCNGIIPLTPEKIEPAPEAANSSTDNPAKTPVSSEVSPSSTTALPAPPVAIVTSAESPDTVPASKSVSQDFGENLNLFKSLEEIASNSTVARRHSLSTIDRTPPNGSLAAEILGRETPGAGLLRTKLMLDELKEQLSDFGSCYSDETSSCCSSNEDTHDDSEKVGFQSMNEKKRGRKKKRKLKLTPGKEEFKKKPNLTLSN